MKSKLLGLLTFGILAILVFTAFTSATITFSNVPTLSKDAGNHTATITVTSTEDSETITFSGLTTLTSDGKQIIFTPLVPIDSGVANTAHPVDIDYYVDEGFKFDEDLMTSLTANDGAETTQDISFEYSNLEGYADNGDLSLDVEFSVDEGFGEDDEWYPMDEITVEVEVSSNNKDLEKIVVEWGLYDLTNNNWIVDGEEDDFDLDEDDDETITINFKLDEDAIDELDIDSTNYRFYVWATGEDAEDIDEKTSTYSYSNIDMQIEDDLVVLSDIELSESASCGDDLQITADVWNIGEDKQEDVYVIIYNKELGINEKVEIGDIKSFKNSDFGVILSLPENVEEKVYYLEFFVYGDGDLYESDNDDDDESKFIKSIKIGSCSTTPKISVSAVLESEQVIAGKDLIVKAVIENTGSNTAILNLGLSDYTDWASSENLDKNALTLNAGESAEVIIKLSVNKGISGSKNFNIIITEGDKILTQPVSVNVEKSSMFPGITGMFSGIAGGNNWYLWAIGALNVLLVLVIIIVAVKVAKKKEE